MASLSTIEGLGPRNAQKLTDAGATTAEKLLEAGATRKGRNALAKETGFEATRILEWVNRVDLTRVKGVSAKTVALLEAAGVDTVKELRRRNAANLVEAMDKANARRKKNPIVDRIPSEKVVQKWIDAAKETELVVKP